MGGLSPIFWNKISTTYWRVSNLATIGSGV